MKVFQSPEAHNVKKLKAQVLVCGKVDPFVYFSLRVTNNEGGTDTIDLYSRTIPLATFEAIAAAINAEFIEEKKS